MVAQRCEPAAAARMLCSTAYIADLQSLFFPFSFASLATEAATCANHPLRTKVMITKEWWVAQQQQQQLRPASKKWVEGPKKWWNDRLARWKREDEESGTQPLPASRDQ